MRINRANATRLLAQGRFLYLTLGNEPCYQINGAGVVPKRLAQDLTGDLFGELDAPRVDMLVPQEDGLFPGFSQTWRSA